MKRFLTILCALALLAACGAVTVYAEDSAAYRDDVYSFRYPASWKQGTTEGFVPRITCDYDSHPLLKTCTILHASHSP